MRPSNYQIELLQIPIDRWMSWAGATTASHCNTPQHNNNISKNILSKRFDSRVGEKTSDALLRYCHCVYAFIGL